LESFDPVGDDLCLERRCKMLLREEEGDAYEAVRRWLTEVNRNHWKSNIVEASELQGGRAESKI